MILEEVEQAIILREQVPAPTEEPPGDAPPPDSSAPDAAMDGTDTPEEGAEGLDGADPAGGEGADLGTPGVDGGAAGTEEGGDLADDGTDGMDMGGGGFGGGGFGGGGFGGGGGGGGDDLGGDGDDEGDDSGNLETTPEGEPEKRPGDPVGAALEEAEKIAKQTTSVPTIVNAVKASIQVNFASYEDAWPLVGKLRDTGDKTLSAVADRLSLFIAGVLQEKKSMIRNDDKKSSIAEGVGAKLLDACGLSGEVDGRGTVSVFPSKRDSAESIKSCIDTFKRNGYRVAEMGRSPGKYRQPYIIFSPDRKRTTMKISNAELKEMINEMISQKNKETAQKSSGGVVITKEQLQSMVREAVRTKLQETTGYVEQERMRQEVNILALEFLEKLTTKLNIDTGALSPEALQTYKIIHKQLEDSVRKCAAEIFQLGAVVNAAEETPS